MTAPTLSKATRATLWLTVFIVGDLLKIAADAAILDPRAPWGKLFDRIRF